MLNLNSMYDNPSIGLDLGDALTASDVDALTQPTANQNGSSGFSVNNALNGILNLFDRGFEVYQSVTNKIGTGQQADNANTQPNRVVVSAAQPAVVFGLSTNQLLLIAAGLTAVLVIPRLLRK